MQKLKLCHFFKVNYIQLQKCFIFTHSGICHTSYNIPCRQSTIGLCFNVSLLVLPNWLNSRAGYFFYRLPTQYHLHFTHYHIVNPLPHCQPTTTLIAHSYFFNPLPLFQPIATLSAHFFNLTTTLSIQLRPIFQSHYHFVIPLPLCLSAHYHFANATTTLSMPLSLCQSNFHSVSPLPVFTPTISHKSL